MDGWPVFQPAPYQSLFSQRALAARNFLASTDTLAATIVCINNCLPGLPSEHFGQPLGLHGELGTDREPRGREHLVEVGGLLRPHLVLVLHEIVPAQHLRLLLRVGVGQLHLLDAVAGRLGDAAEGRDLRHGGAGVADQFVVADGLDGEAGGARLVPDGDHVGAVERREAVARHVLAVEAAVDVLDLRVPLVGKMSAKQDGTDLDLC